MKRWIVRALCLLAVIGAASWESVTKAEANCANVAAGGASDGGYGIVLSSFVTGCNTSMLGRMWTVWRWQANDGTHCDTGDTCKWVIIWSPWYETYIGQYNTTINCWSSQYAFIGTTQFAIDFYYQDETGVHGPVRPPMFTAC